MKGEEYTAQQIIKEILNSVGDNPFKKTYRKSFSNPLTQFYKIWWWDE